MRKEDIEGRLTEDERRHLFKLLHFRFSGQDPNGAGWIGEVLGPEELGEGENGNFSLNLKTGAVVDHGSTGYKGDLYQAAQDVLGVGFPEALAWIAREIGYICPEAAHPRPRREASKTKPRWDPFKDGRLAETYRYTDLDGAELFEAVRFEVRKSHAAYPDKTFRVRHRDPLASGKYSWGFPDSGPVLYRLPRAHRAA